MPSLADAAAAGCFHCGLPIPAGDTFRIEAASGPRIFCCAGCAAVSTAISGLGLDDYYRLRARNPARPEGERERLEAFDPPSMQASFVTALPDGRVEADLVIEGLHCAACSWLVENALLREPGVAAANVLYATRRARVRWDPAVSRPSAVMRAVERVGYRAWPFDESRLRQVEAEERRSLLRRLWVAGLAMMQVMMYAVPAYVAGEGEIGAGAESLMRWAGLVITVPVIAYSAAPMFVGAWRDLRGRRLGMDVPVVLGLAVAFGASTWTTLAGVGEVYFDSVAMFVFLLLGARYLELLARARSARSLLRLSRLVPQIARRLRGSSSVDSHEVPRASLVPGDRVLVLPGESLPADGELESAEALLDEAWMTGESRPVTHVAGDKLLGGAVNAGSALQLRVTHVGDATALSAIHRLMERALAGRPRWAQSAQRVVPWFVAGVLACSALAFVAWLALDPSRAPWVAVSVLIVTCPCALALAAPAAVTAATGALARCGVVVTRPDAIESLAGVTDVVFDKTGTITSGLLALAQVYLTGRRTEAEAIDLAAALARGSAHPIDLALVEAGKGGTRIDASLHASFAGQGVEAFVAGRRMRLGRAAFCAEVTGSSPPLAFVGGTDPIVWLADETEWIAALRFADGLRPRAAEAVEQLRDAGLRVHLLSGDRGSIVARIAAQAGIERWASEATPEAKRAYVGALQARGARVAMVGDGINDGPVLAQADVSLAMDCGADIAKVSADAVLLGDSPLQAAGALAIARTARRIVRQNLAWACAYNVVAIPLAVAGLLTPLAAAVGMSASSLLVVGNALRIRP